MTIRAYIGSLFPMLWIGACVEALVWQTRLLAGLPLQFGWLDGFVFGSTVFGYFCTHPVRTLRWLAWLSGAGAAICFFEQHRIMQFLALGPALLWGAYYGLQRPGRGGLRQSPLLKPIVIAWAWAWTTVWLPAQQLLAWQFTARMAFIFSLALAYDLADMQYDRRLQFVTLAGQLGERRTYYLIYILLGLAALCTGLNFLSKNITWAMAVSLWASYLLSALLLTLILDNKWQVVWKKVVIDGLMIIEALFVLLAVL